MKKEEHKALLEQLQKATTDAERMECIIKLDQDYTGVLNERDTAIQERDTVTIEKNKYAELNNKLWLENSAQLETEKNITVDINKDHSEHEEPPTKLSYGDLEHKFEEEIKGE